MRLEQLAYRLELAGLARRGEDLYIHYMPPSVSRAVVILPSLAGDPINWELGPNWRNAHAFQVVVRDPKIPDGLNRATEINNALTILQTTTLPAMPDLNIPSALVRYIRPRHDIIAFPRSPANYFEFSTNFDAAFSLNPE